MKIELKCIPVPPQPPKNKRGFISRANQKAPLRIAMELLGLSEETENEKQLRRDDRSVFPEER